VYLLISYVRLSGFKCRLSDLNTSTSTYLVLKGFKNRSHTENFNPKLEPPCVEGRITMAKTILFVILRVH
jgi:hypothetical protein